jgi:hypothetical protein
MAKNIRVFLDGEESSFAFKAVDRASLYGKRRRIALDKEGNPCSKASLLEDGSLLLKSGMTAQGYFLEDGTFLKQSDLEGFDINWNPLTKTPSTLGEVQKLEGPVNPNDVLDLRVKTVYSLDPVALNAFFTTIEDWLDGCDNGCNIETFEAETVCIVPIAFPAIPVYNPYNTVACN